MCGSSYVYMNMSTTVGLYHGGSLVPRLLPPAKEGRREGGPMCTASDNAGGRPGTEATISV